MRSFSGEARVFRVHVHRRDKTGIRDTVRLSYTPPMAPTRTGDDSSGMPSCTFRTNLLVTMPGTRG